MSSVYFCTTASQLVAATLPDNREQVLVDETSPYRSLPKFSETKMNYIKRKYEHTLFGKEHLFYPAKNPRRLLVVFNGAGAIGRYSMFSWYWKDDEQWSDTAYLFLRDDELCWYLGNNQSDFVQDYSNLIKHYIDVCKLKNDSVFTIGGSMGGYGALFYATVLGLKGVIAVNPQANKASNDITRFGINNTGNRWQDLDMVIKNSTTAPSVFLIYGNDPRDIAASDSLIEVLKEKAPVLIIRRHESEKHAIARLIFSKELIEDGISFIEKQRTFAIETKGIDEYDNESIVLERV